VIFAGFAIVSAAKFAKNAGFLLIPRRLSRVPRRSMFLRREIREELIMAASVKPIPEGYHTVTPYLIFDRAADAIAFYKKAFGATEIMRMDAPGGRIGHAEIKLGDSAIMLADEHPEEGALSPRKLGGSPVMLHVYVADVDAMVERAVAAGAKLIRPIADQFYGDRTGSLEDPFGYRWSIATHKEDLSTDEIRRRAAAQGH
jgi:PhnB protein